MELSKYTTGRGNVCQERVTEETIVPRGKSEAIFLPTGSVEKGTLLREQHRRIRQASHIPVARALLSRWRSDRFSALESAGCTDRFPAARAQFVFADPCIPHVSAGKSPFRWRQT